MDPLHRLGRLHPQRLQHRQLRPSRQLQLDRQDLKLRLLLQLQPQLKSRLPQLLLPLASGV